MGLIQRLREAFRPQAKITDAAELRELLDQALGGMSSSGLTVNAKKAIGQAAASTAVLVLGETVGQLPFNIMRRLPEGGSEPVPDHPVQRLLGNHGRPNPWTTSFRFRELATRHVALWGNFYALKNTVRGEVRELLPLHPKRVTANQDENFRITYEVSTPQGRQRFDPEEIFHLRGPSDDGFSGLDRINQHKDTLGLGLAQDTHAAKLFANGTKLGGVLKHPGTLKDETREALRRQFAEVYSGPENAHKTAVLEEGMAFEKMSMTAEEGQLLESRKLQRSVIASLWRVPPHMIGDLEKSTFSNIENLARQFVDYALMPWLIRWEQDCELQLLSQQEVESGLFVRLDPRALLRGDAKTRAEFYNKGISGLWLNPNEVREKEDLPPREGGNEFRNPNIDTSGEEPEEDDDENTPEPEPIDPDNRSNRAPIPLRPAGA